MIIAINGNIGVGKDTVADIICKKCNYEHKKFTIIPSDIYKQITGVNYSLLSRNDKELHRKDFITFCQKCKDIFGKDVWAKLLLKEYGNGDNWVISDLRFPEEYNYVKSLGGVVINVNRNVEQNSNDNNSLIDYPFDYYISNNGSIDELEISINKLLVLL